MSALEFYPDEAAYTSTLIQGFDYLEPEELARVVALLPALLRERAAGFAVTKDKYVSAGGGARYHRYHFDQYSQVMIAVACAIHAQGDIDLAEKIYFFNRSRYQIDWYPAIAMPTMTGFNHGSGAVIGRFSFTPGSSLYFCQACTIGSNVWFGAAVSEKAVTPDGYCSIDGHLTMFPNSQLVGSRVEGRVALANGACVINAVLPDLSICFGRSPNLEVRRLTKEKWANLCAFRLPQGAES